VKARDKLSQLSAVQFMELSTDVYDEMNRREDETTQSNDIMILFQQVFFLFKIVYRQSEIKLDKSLQPYSLTDLRI
jgi:hypothetical protein